MHNKSTDLCNEFVQCSAWDSQVNRKGLASHPSQPLLLKCELKTGGGLEGLNNDIDLVRINKRYLWQIQWLNIGLRQKWNKRGIH